MFQHLKRYWWRYVLGIVLTPPILVLLIGVALYVPSVQDWTLGIVERQASEALGMQVHIGRLRLLFPLDLSLREVTIERSPQDTMLCLGRIDASITPLALLKKHAIIPSLSLETLYYRDVDSVGTETRVYLASAKGERLGLNWEQEDFLLASLLADSLDVYYHQSDTTTKPPSEPTKWKLKLGNVLLRHSRAVLAMPNDSLFIDTDFELLSLQRLSADLLPMRIELGEGELRGAKLAYSVDGKVSDKPYLDYKRINTSELNLHLGRVVSEGSYLDLMVKEGAVRERSGFEIKGLRGLYQMDSLRMRLSDLELVTGQSELNGYVDIPWEFFKGDTTVVIESRGEAKLAMADIRKLAGQSLSEHQDFVQIERSLATILNKPLELGWDAVGTLNQMQINAAHLTWQGIAQAELEGMVHYIPDHRRRRGQLRFSAHLEQEAQALLALAGTKVEQSYKLPPQLHLKGDVDISKQYYKLSAQAEEGSSSVDVQGLYNQLSKQYEAKLKLNEVNLKNYIPLAHLGDIDMELNLVGQGFDPLSPKTNTKLQARINNLNYQALSLKDISVDAAMKQGVMYLTLNSFNPGLNVSLIMDGILSKEHIQTNIVLDSEDIDFKALGLSETMLATKFRLMGELSSDLKDTHNFLADVQGMSLILGSDTIKPHQVSLEAKTSSSHSMAHLSSGDLNVKLDIGEAPSLLTKRSDRLAILFNRVIQEIKSPDPMKIQLEHIIRDLPALDLDMELGKDNALRPVLAQHRLAVERLEGQLRLRPSIGLEGHITARDLRQDTLRLNCVDLSINTERIERTQVGQTGLDSMRLNLDFRLDKMRFRNQRGFSFGTQMNASLQDLKIKGEMRDERSYLQHQLALLFDWDRDSYRLNLPESKIVLAGQTYQANEGNYLRLSKGDYFLSSDLSLQGDAGGQIKLLAQHDGTKQQEANLSIMGIQLERLRGLGLPDISGKMLGEINYTRQGGIKEQPTLNGDVSIQNLSYEDKLLGHFATAFFYEPRNDNSHYITADVSYKGNQALSINGIYTPHAKDNALRGDLKLIDFPLELANPFTSQFATYLGGTLSGDLALGGTPSAPKFSGKVLGQTAQVELREYATTLQLDSLPLFYEGDKVRLNNYAIRPKADPERPIYLDGTVTTQGKDMLSTNLSLRAQETMLMNQAQPKDDTQMLYGKLITSANMRLTGRLNALKIRGNLDIKNGTNCTYVMKESALDAGDKTSGLVRFTDFADTIFMPQVVTEAELGGVDLSLAIGIDPMVRFNVDLSADHQDYVRMQGGGALQLRYLPYGEMRLLGRYEMSSGGTMQYTLPVVGSKLFNIERGGYIAFDGDVRNPLVSLTATQRVRAAIGDAAGTRTNFLVSIKLKNKVENINLGFDLAAPENLSVQNSLAAMSNEERGKQAIGLLATGTYLGGGSAGDKLNLNETFAALIQNQINTMAGSLLSGTDLSIGMEMDGKLGNEQQTNYTYSFSRRFYNDRIRLVIGGKIHTGQQITTREQSLIDNVAVEYQLDEKGERFFQVYHKRVTDNVIEGEYKETGLGLYLRRKLNKLGDVFRFGQRKVRTQAPTDSLTVDSLLPARKTSFTLPLPIKTDTLPSIQKGK